MRRHDKANRGAMMGKERIRDNGNFFGGWFIVLFLVGMGLVLDPFGVFQDPIRDGSSRFWWLAIAGLIAGSAAAYTFFSKPYVEVEAATLIVQNR